VYLATARAHPPAAVARQRERDFRLAYPLVEKLTERAYELLLVFHAVVRRHRKAALPPLVDGDVAEAAKALAATFETAERGIIYEHQAASLQAQRLVRDWTGSLTSVQSRLGAGFERDAVIALRRIEQGARQASEVLGESQAAYLDFLDRLPGEIDDALHAEQPSGDAPQAETPSPQNSRIILS
jgi:hypothetical protein